MPQHVFVSDYDSSWPKKYQKERSLVSRILGNNLIAIYHIGSTSVPGLAASLLSISWLLCGRLQKLTARKRPLLQ